MNKCKGYKFEKGEQLGSSSSGDGGNLNTTEYRYHLRITDDKGTVIAEVDQTHMKYIEEVSPGFFWDTTDEYLRIEGWPGDYGIKDFFIEFENGKFVLTGKNINTMVKIDNFTLTGDGKELLSECSASAHEYHVPPYHSCDQEGCGTYNEPLAPDFDLL
ncbi:hypothetical protein [Wolbachia endosymbiont of Folsomia candida]|uniref:hypothetical protein n=1 Tax=Wolbachia endosymbiont of Folsomia candida TaxID=169402 RepID=UPI000B2F3288|nr:hypothetical protein [Wolbachia endosymbiont of Folsomia candida]APR98209.1 hypothetical protein ASM33_02770 [Wolbachia endosymbiont of Folsomia candida]